MVYSTGSDLRELPWVKRRLGRKAVRYYANASKVYISNFDRYTYNALRYLGLLSYMTFPLPYTPFHKPSGESLGPWREILARVGFFKNKYKWVVLLASSLDWTEHRFRWTKRSDIFLRGYSRFVQEGHDVGCIIRQSGVDKENIHNLIEELGIQDQCMFIPTVDNLVLPSVFRMVDVVADQFDIGTFGGTALEAMSAGKPVLVKIDSSYHNMVYSSHAPILNCGDESDVYLHLKRLDSADYRDEIGKAAKEWLKTNNLFDQSVARLADDIHILFKDWDRSLVRLNPLY
jgi:glycosyltransferase involved in cell wall biosynthesis